MISGAEYTTTLALTHSRCCLVDQTAQWDWIISVVDNLRFPPSVICVLMHGQSNGTVTCHAQSLRFVRAAGFRNYQIGALQQWYRPPETVAVTHTHTDTQVQLTHCHSKGEGFFIRAFLYHFNHLFTGKTEEKAGKHVGIVFKATFKFVFCLARSLQYYCSFILNVIVWYSFV